jgi:hypothetical protein
MAACPAKVFMIAPKNEFSAKNALTRINFIAVIIGFYIIFLKNIKIISNFTIIKVSPIYPEI